MKADINGRIIKSVFVILLFFNVNLFANVSCDSLKQFQNGTTTVNPEWELFYNDHAFNKMYLVFAGPYPASPTSSFGHIFVLLEPQKDKPFLLWDALDFSADVTNVGSLEFIFQGIFGTLEGHYKITSFYEKLREYTFIESRSLWMFPVQLDSCESKNFLFQYFNLQKDIHPYRFSNKNCASEIYNLLRHSIDGSYKQEDGLVFPHTIINELKDRIKEPVFIESIYSLLKDNAGKTILNGNSDTTNSGDNTDAAIALNLLEWKYANENSHLTSEEINTLQNLRKKVSSSGSKNYSSFKSYPKAFDIHPTMLAGSGFRIGGRESAEYLLTYRFGIHEYFEKCNVYPEDDFLSLLKIELGIRKQGIQINHLMLFNQTSLQPVSFLSNFISWKLGFGLLRKDELSDRPLAGGIFAGFGYSVSLIENRIKLSFLLDAEPVYLKSSGLSLLSGPELIARWNISDGISWMGNLKGTLKILSNPKMHYNLENNLGIHLSEKTILLLANKLNEYGSSYEIKLNYYIN